MKSERAIRDEKAMGYERAKISEQPRSSERAIR